MPASRPWTVAYAAEQRGRVKPRIVLHRAADFSIPHLSGGAPSETICILAQCEWPRRIWCWGRRSA